MNNKYFVLDGESSLRYGIVLQSHPVFSQPEQKVEKVSVAGRNGDLLLIDKSFNNVEGTLRCYVLKEQAYDALSEANYWLFKSYGYRRFEFDGDSYAYRMARIVNGAECSIRMKRLAPFEIELDAKPQRFLYSGEQVYTFTESGILCNPAYYGSPLIRVYGESGSVAINGKSIQISEINEYIDVDCELKDAYKGTTNCNSSISCTDFPEFVADENQILISGDIDKVEITPRWWTL